MDKRLQSLKLPRDLTLGGTKPKKVYTPNLGVVRNKEKSKEFLKKHEDKTRHKLKKDKFSNKNNDIKTDRFVKSSGIFSDGFGDSPSRKNRYERSYGSKEDTNSLQIPIPTVKKDEWKIDNKVETKIYNDIMKNNDSSDDEEDEKLPFRPLTWDQSDLTEVKVKLEEASFPKDFQDDDNVSDSNPSLTLWNMPDSFAGKGLSDDPNIKKLFDYKLNDMQEGQIGKLIIRKSGKMEVVIGSVKYDLEPSNLESFSARLVHVEVKDNTRSKSTVLGSVQNNYTLNPDWNTLLS